MKYIYLSPVGVNLTRLPEPLPKLYFDWRALNVRGVDLHLLLEDPQPVEIIKIVKRWGRGAEDNYNIWLVDGRCKFNVETYLILKEDEQ